MNHYYYMTFPCGGGGGGNEEGSLEQCVAGLAERLRFTAPRHDEAKLIYEALDSLPSGPGKWELRSDGAWHPWPHESSKGHLIVECLVDTRPADDRWRGWRRGVSVRQALTSA